MKEIKFSFDKTVFYQSKSIDQFKSIKPRWAVGQNVGEQLFQANNEEYKTIWVSTERLIAKSDMMEVNVHKLFTGENSNDVRIARLLFRWEHSLFVDPPIIGINPSDTKPIVFEDGRHRTKLIYLLGITNIPVMMRTEDKDILTSILTELE